MVRWKNKNRLLLIGRDEDERAKNSNFHKLKEQQISLTKYFVGIIHGFETALFLSSLNHWLTSTFMVVVPQIECLQKNVMYETFR